MKINPTFLELIFLLSISLCIYIWARYGRKIKRWWKELRKRRRGPQQLRPRKPDDCPECAKGYHRLPRWPRQEVVPWSEIKSTRSRKKVVDTSGYGCLNIWCKYFGNTDPAVHALVSDGNRGKGQDILYLRCQCCGKRKTSRVFGIHPTTISLWIERAGQHSERLHERLFFQAVKAGHVQLDELYTRVKSVAGTVLVWSAITAKTKLIFALHIGGQAIEDACLLFHQIRLRLVEGCKPVFTSDGRNQYFHGMTAHYGYWDKPPRARVFHWFPTEDLLYAQIRKERRGRKVKFLYPAGDTDSDPKNAAGTGLFRTDSDFFCGAGLPDSA